MVVEKRKFQDKQSTGGDSPKFPKLASKGQARYFNPEGNGKPAGGAGGGGGGGGRPNQNFNKGPGKFNKGGQGGKPNFNNRGAGGGAGGKGNFQQGKKNFNNSDGDSKMDIKPKQELGTNEQSNQKPPHPHQNKNKNKKNKGNMNKGPGPLNKVSDDSKAIKKAIKKEKSKSRFMKMQSTFDRKERSESACKAALALEQQLAPKSRVLTVKIQDPEITVDKAKSWSPAIEGVEINRIIGPRQILVFLKPNANIKKEIEKLKKVNFSGGTLLIEEKKVDSKDAGGDEVDPFSLYVTNLPDKITKEQLKAFFPKASRMSTIRKHNPKKGYVGKFMFINYDSEADALEAFKENFNRKIEDRMILIRFRRISANLDQQNKVTPKSEAVATPAAAAVNNKSLNKTPVNAKDTPKKGQQPTPKPQDGKKATPAKTIKMEEEDSEDDDDSEEEIVAPLKGKAALLKGLKAQAEDDDEEDESSEDDEDDGLDVNIKEEADDDEDDDDDDDDDDGQAKVSSDEDDDDEDEDDDDD